MRVSLWSDWDLPYTAHWYCQSNLYQNLIGFRSECKLTDRLSLRSPKPLESHSSKKGSKAFSKVQCLIYMSALHNTPCKTISVFTVFKIICSQRICNEVSRTSDMAKWESKDLHVRVVWRIVSFWYWVMNDSCCVCVVTPLELFKCKA